MQQIADHMARSRADGAGPLPTIYRDIRAVKWRLWHGRVDRAIRDLEQLLERVKDSQVEGEFSIARLHSLGSQLLTYVRSNRGAIVNYGKRYRTGLRVATTLAESAVNSLVGKRMIKSSRCADPSMVPTDAPNKAEVRGSEALFGARTRAVRNRTRPLSTKDSNCLSAQGFLCNSSGMVS